MKMLNFNKLPIVCAVSTAFLAPLTVIADEMDEQVAAVKLSNYEQQLLVNTFYQEGTATFVEAELLSKVDSLPVECDPQSAFPVSEQHVDNPADALVGDWKANTEFFDDVEEGDDVDGDFPEDDLNDDDDMDEDESEQEDGMDSEDNEQDEQMEDEEADEDNDQNSDDETDDGESNDQEAGDDELDMDFEGDFDAYLTVTASGYLVTSEVETVDGVATCNVKFIGEVNGDTYTPTTTGSN